MEASQAEANTRPPKVAKKQTGSAAYPPEAQLVSSSETLKALACQNI